MLQTQTFWALAAATLGSTFVKATSLKPLMRTRLGTDAEIDTDPVEVAPRLPCVEALAVPAAPNTAAVARLAPTSLEKSLLLSTVPNPPLNPPFGEIHPKWMYSSRELRSTP